jgi:hypothetical protein
MVHWFWIDPLDGSDRSSNMMKNNTIIIPLYFKIIDSVKCVKCFRTFAKFNNG